MDLPLALRIIPIANYGQDDDGAAAAGGGGPGEDGDVPTLASLLERDLHLYLGAARGFTFDHGDVDTFTAAVLAWWKNHGAQVGRGRSLRRSSSRSRRNRQRPSASFHR